MAEKEKCTDRKNCPNKHYRNNKVALRDHWELMKSMITNHEEDSENCQIIQFAHRRRESERKGEKREKGGGGVEGKSHNDDIIRIFEPYDDNRPKVNNYECTPGYCPYAKCGGKKDIKNVEKTSKDQDKSGNLNKSSTMRKKKWKFPFCNC